MAKWTIAAQQALLWRVLVLPGGEHEKISPKQLDTDGVFRMSRKPLFLFSALLLFLMFCSLLLLESHAQWQYQHDDNGAWYSSIARTHLRVGLISTRGQDFLYVKAANTLQPYLHHPPLLGLYLAGIFQATGRSDPFMTRVSMILIHIGSFILFYMVLAVLFTNQYGLRLWALFVFSVTPMSVFFGKMPNHEPISLFWILAWILAYLQYLKSNRLLYMAVAMFSALLTAFSAWHGVLCLACLAVGAMIFTPARGAVGFGGVSLATLLIGLFAVILQIYWANGWNPLSGQWQSLSHWSSGVKSENTVFFYFESLLHIAEYACKFYGFIPYALSVIWILTAGGKRNSTVTTLLYSMALGTGLYSVVFFHAARVHSYQQFYWLPFVAISSGLALARGYDILSRHFREKTVQWAMTVIVLFTLVGSLAYLARVYEWYDYAVLTSSEIHAKFL